MGGLRAALVQAYEENVVYVQVELAINRYQDQRHTEGLLQIDLAKRRKPTQRLLGR